MVQWYHYSVPCEPAQWDTFLAHRPVQIKADRIQFLIAQEQALVELGHQLSFQTYPDARDGAIIQQILTIFARIKFPDEDQYLDHRGWRKARKWYDFRRPVGRPADAWYIRDVDKRGKPGWRQALVQDFRHSCQVAALCWLPNHIQGLMREIEVLALLDDLTMAPGTGPKRGTGKPGSNRPERGFPPAGRSPQRPDGDVVTG